MYHERVGDERELGVGDEKMHDTLQSKHFTTQYRAL